MKIRHELEIHATGRRTGPPQGEQPNETIVRLKVTIEGARGEPIVGALQDIMRGTERVVAADLDRRPY